MNYDHLSDVYEDYLEHYGILGMKWGIRRYQNSDGTLTAAGKKRYKNDTPEQIERSERRKAKVKKAVKIGAKVGISVGLMAIGVRALDSGWQRDALILGARDIDRMMSSGMLSKEKAASLLSNAIGREGQRYVDLSKSPYEELRKYGLVKQTVTRR